MPLDLRAKATGHHARHCICYCRSQRCSAFACSCSCATGSGPPRGLEASPKMPRVRSAERRWRRGCLFRSGARVVSCPRQAGQRPRRNVILVLHLHGLRTAAGCQQPNGAACRSRSCPTVAPAAWRQQVQRLYGAKTCASPGGACSLAFLRAVAAGRRHLRQLERRRSGTGGLEAPGAAAVRRQDLR